MPPPCLPYHPTAVIVDTASLLKNTNISQPLAAVTEVEANKVAVLVDVGLVYGEVVTLRKLLTFTGIKLH